MSLTRRAWAGSAAAALLAQPGDALRIWVFSDAHVGTDLRRGRRSLAEAIQHSESGFDWDVALDLGDQSGGQSLPDDEEGEQVVRQFGALRKHRREDVFSISGNHDRSGLHEESNWWWRKWLDPMGENSAHSGVHAARRRFALSGTWERYSFRVGNLLFLMMCDINEPSQIWGRGTLGGNPGGVVSAETFAWWKQMVEVNPDSTIISAHHYMLKNTTVASGEWEGFRKDPRGAWQPHYHGYYPQGEPKGASYLYWVGGQPDAQAFERYLQANPGRVALWLGGHTHTNPEDRYGGRSHFEQKWGTAFLNASALSAHHGGQNVPMSRLLTLRHDEVRVQCYLHNSQFAARGWYEKAERRFRLPRPLAL